MARAQSKPLLRAFEPADAEQVARLLDVLSPGSVQTAESLRHKQVSEPSRARRASWVVVEGREVIGFATACLHWFGGEAGKGRMWIGVRKDRRRRGVGSELWEACVGHLAGARKHTVEVDDDPAGLRFVERRGFTQYDSEVIPQLDPRACTIEREQSDEFHVRSLGEVRDREHDLFEFYVAAGGVPPGDPENRVSPAEWRAAILESPLLDNELSVVVLDADDRVVSLAWLLVDLGRRRAENEWTATLPHLRGRGLARLAKLASIRAAAAPGITEIVTGNHPDNLPMRELNHRLGYRDLFLRRDFERPC
jgi:GNAT superfamily N-acetyltransferase